MIYEFLSSRILASQLSTNTTQKVTISGWLHKKRSLGNLTFLLVRDRSGLIQVVIESLQEAAKLHGLYQGTIVTIEGIVQQESRAPQGVEIHNPLIYRCTCYYTEPY